MLCVVWGGAVAAEGPRVQLGFGAATSHIEGPAQAAIFEAFFGIPFEGAGQESLFGTAGNNGAGVNLQQGTRLSLGLSQPLWRGASGWGLNGGVALSYARQSYDLPDGIGIFIDPAQVEVRSVSVWADLELAYERERADGRRFDIGLAAGHVETRFRAHLRSALLDVETDGRTEAQYLRLRTGLDLMAPPEGGRPRINATVTRFSQGSNGGAPAGAWDVGLGLEIAF